MRISVAREAVAKEGARAKVAVKVVVMDMGAACMMTEATMQTMVSWTME